MILTCLYLWVLQPHTRLAHGCRPSRSTQQLCMVCWSCCLCRFYFLIKNEGRSIFSSGLIKSVTLSSLANPQMCLLWKKSRVLLVFIKNRREKNLAPGIIAFVSSIYRLLSSAELMSAKWANLKDPFSLISFKNPMLLAYLKIPGRKDHLGSLLWPLAFTQFLIISFPPVPYLTWPYIDIDRAFDSDKWCPIYTIA